MKTEEATKTAFVLPFISFLGYDVFSPSEVVPEFVADIGTKKGEKVDYAIIKNNEPIVLIECKHWSETLDLHGTQLMRYFQVTKARFGILTNGILYRFYTDLEASNIMDSKPFLELDLSNLKESAVNELKRFQKSLFDVDQIIDSASELKYLREIKYRFEIELKEPKDDFIRYFASKAYSGKLTSKVLDLFNGIVKKAIAQVFNEAINERLKLAISKEKEQQSAEEKEIEEIEKEKESKIVTTQEEIEGYHIIKSIIRKEVDASLIKYKDLQQYFLVYFEKVTQPICRLYFTSKKKKYIALFEENREEGKILIKGLNDIYNYSAELIETLNRYIVS